MKSEIKDGLFTSTQVSKLLGVNVQTLREWQRKKYLAVPETGGWQRYRIEDIALVAAFKSILATGVTHELATKVAAFAYPILSTSVHKRSEDAEMPYLIVNMNPDDPPSFDLVNDLEELPAAAVSTFGQSQTYITRFIFDFKGVYEFVFTRLGELTLRDGSKMFWKVDDQQGDTE